MSLCNKLSLYLNLALFCVTVEMEKEDASIKWKVMFEWGLISHSLVNIFVFWCFNLLHNIISLESQMMTTKNAKRLPDPKTTNTKIHAAEFSKSMKRKVRKQTLEIRHRVFIREWFGNQHLWKERERRKERKQGWAEGDVDLPPPRSHGG